LDYWTRPQTHTLEITCTEGSIRWDYIGGAFRIWETGTGTWRAEPFPGVGGRDELFMTQARHFLDVVAGRVEPACTPDDGIAAVRIAAAIERSSHEGGGRVEPAGASV